MTSVLARRTARTTRPSVLVENALIQATDTIEISANHNLEAMSRYRTWNFLNLIDALVYLSLVCLFSTSLLGQETDMSIDALDGTTSVVIKDYSIGPCRFKTNFSCPDPDVKFRLFTRPNDTSEGEEIYVNATYTNLLDTDFDLKSPTKIVVHGYNADMDLDVLIAIREEYLAKGPHNVIAVDWKKLAAGPCYPVAVGNVPHVGRCLAQLIKRLRDFSVSDIHVIGFSLGAHVPAFAANYLRPYKLPRISGLDPAMPLFVTSDRDHKLDSSDAHFVDVIHTNALMQGKLESSGHVDFYMNGGINQPGCWGTMNPISCSHHRAPMYFAESINSKVGFWAWPCPNFFIYFIGFCAPRFPAVRAGDPADRNYAGIFIAKTREKSPFAQGIFSNEPRNRSRQIHLVLGDL